MRQLFTSPTGGEFTDVAARFASRNRLAAARHDGSANVRDVVARVASFVERTPMGARLSQLNTIHADLHARIDTADTAEALGNLIATARSMFVPS
jgi:hypothetical protein